VDILPRTRYLAEPSGPVRHPDDLTYLDARHYGPHADPCQGRSLRTFTQVFRFRAFAGKPRRVEYNESDAASVKRFTQFDALSSKKPFSLNDPLRTTTGRH
jgi:hypothetical protein